MTGSVTALALSLATLQAPAAPPPPALATEALVQEVRALRQAVEEALAANVRVQLLMGRLQLQEARIQSLVRQGVEIDSQIQNMVWERQGLASQQKTIQAALEEMSDPRQDREVKQHLAMLTERIKHLDTRQAALLAEQANVQQLVAAEQGRWGDFNARLEELERLLAAQNR